MAETMRHRGPDDEGYHVSGQVGLGFRRLSIIDLSGGHQPLTNEDATVWIIFNGEIYNYRELRQFLLAKGHVFKTQSDTEVILHLYEEVGEACVEKLRGMFAFAIWDSNKNVLFLARDRVGIKPLYYFLSEKFLIFASEIKAILADPEVKPEVLPEMIDRFMAFHYLPGEETLLRNVYKLAPGSYMLVRPNAKPEIRQYWDLQFPQSDLSLREAEIRLSELLEETVGLHMISDVPVGFLLSGGVDSTALLSLAVGKTDLPLSSYTIGFSEDVIADERTYARLAADKFGVEHHEMSITPKDFADFMPDYVRYMEEPAFEPPGVALYYICRLAKDVVKVLISGEGGDEAFAGYPIYRNILWLERLKSLLPLNGALSSSLSFLNQFVRSRRLAKYAPLWSLPFESYYYSGTSIPTGFFTGPISEIYSKDLSDQLNREHSLSTVKRYLGNDVTPDLVNRMLYIDTKTWLAHDLLLKADKMSMANSIELRVPFLDHRMLEFAASLPGKYKVRNFTTKYIARRVLSNSVPREILRRKKAGFPTPFSSWLRTDLSSWVRDILFDSTTLGRGYFEKRRIEHLVAEDLRLGAYSREIFCLVTLELWHRAFLEQRNAPIKTPVSMRVMRPLEA